MDNNSRLVKIGDALSQLLNVALMPNHKQTNANESLSGRAHRQGWRLEKVIDWLFFWQEAHCKTSHLYDIERAKRFLEDNT